MIRKQPFESLTDHAVRILKANPKWTVTMYAALSELDAETTERLRDILRPYLYEYQWR